MVEVHYISDFSSGEALYMYDSYEVACSELFSNGYIEDGSRFWYNRDLGVLAYIGEEEE